jgi:hypothetical protein
MLACPVLEVAGPFGSIQESASKILHEVGP